MLIVYLNLQALASDVQLERSRGSGNRIGGPDT